MQPSSQKILIISLSIFLRIQDLCELIEDTKKRAKEAGREGEVRLGVNAFVIGDSQPTHTRHSGS